MAVRRMLPFIVVNVIVSAAVVLAVLYWWDSRQEPQTREEAPTLAAAIPPLASSATPMTVTRPVEIQEETAENNPAVYVVQRGETLGSISTKLDIPMLDIMEANGIDDPNFIQVDQELIIPGETTFASDTEATPTTDFSELPSPIPDVVQTEGEALIELGIVSGGGDINSESLSIINNGNRSISLAGWRILDEDGSTYTFGQVTLFGEGAAITIHSRSGQDGPTDLYWGRQSAVWHSGETVTLVDSEGTVRATSTVGSTD